MPSLSPRRIALFAVTFALASCGDDKTGPIDGAVDVAPDVPEDVVFVDAPDAPDATDTADTPDLATLDEIAAPDVPDAMTDAEADEVAPPDVDADATGEVDAATDVAPDAVDAGTDAALGTDATAEIADDAAVADVPVAPDVTATEEVSPDVADADGAVPEDAVADAETDAMAVDVNPACNVADCPTPTEACTVATCKADGKCGIALATDGTPCDDGDACTTDTCQTGGCVGAAITCNDGNSCTTDGCDPATGCKVTPHKGSCDDGSVCTVGDTCTDGACVSGAAKTCDDGEPCTDDSCDVTGGCVSVPNSITCTDGDACTTGDFCHVGFCAPGTPTSCDDGEGCTIDSCNTVTGCAHLPSSAACDDGNACTSGDACSLGVCASGSAISCNDNNVCTDDSCDPTSGCGHVANTAKCDDGNKCTTGEACANKTCGGGVSTSCDDGKGCTTDFCDAKTGCYHLAANGTCSDNDPCTAGDYCQAGNCAAGSSYVCDDGIACTTDSCDGAGGCTYSYSDALCNDSNPCTTDSCQTGIGCKHFAAAGPCEDGNPCTTGDTCGAGTCQGGTVKTCDDGNPCTTDSCDPVDGACKGVAGNNGTVCDDKNACTVSDVCGSGTCAGTAKTCSDGNVCTDDGCNTTTGCTFTANTAGCPNANACTTASACNGSGSCVATATMNCDDNNVCTADACNTGNGTCSHTGLNSGACDDGNSCTTGEKCTGGSCVAVLTASAVSTIAGSGSVGGTDGAGSSASFSQPDYGLARLADGSMVTSEWSGYRIRKILPNGTTSTLAGTGSAGSADGAALQASFNNPSGIAVNGAGDIFIADFGNNRIRKLSGGAVSTFAGSTSGYADGTGLAAKFQGPVGLAFDATGMLWVAESSGQRIRTISPSGKVTTVAGTGTAGYLDGPASSAQFNSPSALAFASDGSVAIADSLNYRIRRLSADRQTVSTFAGTSLGYLDGAGTSAKFGTFGGLFYLGQTLLVTDRDNQRIRSIASDGTVGTIAGSGTTTGYVDGAPSSAQFAFPSAMAADSSGVVWLNDTGNQRIRKITFTFPTCNDGNPCTADSCSAGTCAFTNLPATTACSDGNACTSGDACTAGGACVGAAMNCDDSNACTSDFCNPSNLACEHVNLANFTACNDGSVCTSGDTCFYGKCIASPLGTVSTVAGSGTAGYLDGAGSSAMFNSPHDVSVMPDGSLVVADYNNNRIRAVALDGTATTLAGSGTAGFQDGAAASAQFDHPQTVFAGKDGTVYVADNNRIRKVTGGTVSTLVGSGVAGTVDGTGTGAQINGTGRLTLDNAGYLIFAEWASNSVRRISPAGAITTIVGDLGQANSDGPVASAQLYKPAGVAVDPAGNIYIAEWDGFAIRKLGVDGNVTTVLGNYAAGFSEATGKSAQVNGIQAIAWHPAGYLVFTDQNNNRVRAVWPDGTNTTIAGQSTAGYTDGAGATAKFSAPWGMTLRADGSIVMADSANNRIRKITLNQVSCNDNNPCTTDSCNPTTGACVFTPVGQGGGSCDDANPCTIDGCDAGSGLCTHTAGNDGTTCEVNHTCGKCSAGVCGENLLSGSDEFNSTTLGSQWSIVNQDAANWSLSAVPGNLQITALDGDVWGGNNSAKNVFAQAAPSATSYELITKLAFNPGKNYQNAGILIWKDFDNWVWVSRQYCSSCTPAGQIVSVSYEKNSTATGAGTVNVPSTTIWLKLAISGTQATGYYSLDGANWLQLATTTVPTGFTSVGLFAFDTGAGSPYIPANFDFFHVSKGCYP
jgi:regulation of enolase protein 1 (concanavalin A-like superfamily)